MGVRQSERQLRRAGAVRSDVLPTVTMFWRVSVSASLVWGQDYHRNSFGPRAPPTSAHIIIGPPNQTSMKGMESTGLRKM